ncbi:MAG: hypothetical protein ACYTBW_03790 [Planctomycetota bacterium]|jgi:hypothetical protein
MSSTKYIRFVIDKQDEDSQEPQGLFAAVYELKDSNQLSDEHQRQAKDVLRWFSKNLPVPNRFSRSSKQNAQCVAVSWFKPTALKCIERMKDLAGILYIYDIPTRIITTDRPGYVVYEDEYQIAAQPFRGKT